MNEFSVEFARVIETPLWNGKQGNEENVNRGPALAIPVRPELMGRLQTGCGIRTLVDAVQTPAALFPVVALSIGREGVFTALEPGAAETIAVLGAAAGRRWLPVMLHNRNHAFVVRVDWPAGLDELPRLISVAAPLAPVPYAIGLVSSLRPAPVAFERLRSAERPLSISRCVVVSESRLLAQLRAAKDALADAATFRPAATVQ